MGADLVPDATPHHQVSQGDLAPSEAGQLVVQVLDAPRGGLSGRALSQDLHD